jgi:hypothetical protein
LKAKNDEIVRGHDSEKKVRADKADFKSKCAGCLSAAGIASCTVFMTLGAIGVLGIALSQTISMPGMPAVQGSGNPTLLSQIAIFFSGFWGEAIFFVSVILLVLGFAYAKRVRPLVLALIGSLILFVSMYVYFMLAFLGLGALSLVIAYASAYSRKIAHFTRLF